MSTKIQETPRLQTSVAIGEGGIDVEGGKALVVRRVSMLGLCLGIAATGILAGWTLVATLDPELRNIYRTIVGLMSVLLAAWALAFFWSVRGWVRAASVVNLLSAAAASVLFVAIDGGSVLATVSTVIALAAAALLFEGRALRVTGLIGAGSLLISLGLREFGVIGGLSIPRPLLFGATASAIAFGLPTMMAVFRLYGRSLKSSREEAVASAGRLKEANRKLAAHARELQQVTVELERRDSEVRDFMFVAAHDLRAPLINLDGFSAALLEAIEKLDAQIGEASEAGEASASQATAGEVFALWREAVSDLRESARFVADNTTKMEILVKGLLDLSRIDSGPDGTDVIDLDELVAAVASSLRGRLDAGGITLRVGLLPAIEGDRSRVTQLFENLLDNAIKHTSTAPERAIEIACREDEAEFEFSVRDTGCGIRPEDSERIFRPFAQLDPKKTTGEGMGLAAVRKIVERRRCRVWVESEVGQGATFYFTWPIPRPSAVPATVPATPLAS